MNHKISYILVYVGTVVACVLFLASYSVRWLFFPGFAVLVATWVQVGLFLCCPHCGKGLRVKGRRPKFCPECGEKLEW